MTQKNKKQKKIRHPRKLPTWIMAIALQLMPEYELIKLEIMRDDEAAD